MPSLPCKGLANCEFDLTVHPRGTEEPNPLIPLTVLTLGLMALSYVAQAGGVFLMEQPEKLRR